MVYQFFALLCLAAPAVAQFTPSAPAYYADDHERFKAYVFRTYTDPARIAWLLVDSAKDTWSKDPHEWDRSPKSYSYRVASGWGRRIVRNTVQLGFETALHEDSRYRPSAESGFRKRVLFAVGHSVLAYHPDGSVAPAYGRFGAGIAAAAISSTWHPQSIGAGALINGAAQSALDRAGNNLLTEFEPDLKCFGKKTWNKVFRK